MRTDAPLGGLLHIKTAAAALDVHPDTIRRAIRCGELEAVRIGPRGRYRVPVAALARFVVDVEPAGSAGGAAKCPAASPPGTTEERP